MGLKIFSSNRLEILSEKLCQVVREPLACPLAREIVIVQSRGMERWVSMQVARYLGISANISFVFPRAFISRVVSAVMPEFKENQATDAESMTWRILGALPSFVKRPGFEAIDVYLRSDAVEGRAEHFTLKHFQLAERIAHLFDQYLIFRPDMILSWEAGKTGSKEEKWQADIWRKLAEGDYLQHPARVRERFLAKMKQGKVGAADLPERISVFGISSLPRFHLEIIHALASVVNVNLFLMSPSQEFWLDIRSEREMRRELKRVREKTALPTPSEDALYLERGNSLLSSMGTLGREFFSSMSDFQAEFYDSFVEGDEHSLLSAIQGDILNLRDRGRGSDKSQLEISDSDRSVQIHSCHSMMREVEVLSDNILSMFEDNPSLMPKDILVMTPDIEAYAPFIQAVFGVPERGESGDGRFIPFSIADVSVKRDIGIVDMFFEILDLVGSRLEVSRVISILESPCVGRKFDLSEKDIALVRRWVAEVRIYWGLDGDARERMGLPGFPENTWKAGILRLIMGFAMPPKDDRLFEGVLPYGGIEGSDAAVLGRFLTFVDLLFVKARELEHSMMPGEWASALTGIMDGFFRADDDVESERGLHLFRQKIGNLKDVEAKAGFREALGIDVIKQYLKRVLTEEMVRGGFLTGGMTFSAMLPMRSIPFKVICLLGMNSNSFPRESRSVGFDLMAKSPRSGDPSRRNDDRYLFLEAILSAREGLYISHIGQSIEDNSPIPPSVLVSELLDYIKRGFRIEGRDISEHVITRHRLQAFSPQYFRGESGLFSYAEENCRAAKSLLAPRTCPAPFIDAVISEPGDEWRTVDTRDLESFFRNPAKFILQRRLSITLTEEMEELREEELFDLGGLEKYSLDQTLVEKSLAGWRLDDYYPVAKAAGELPYGSVGTYRYSSLARDAERFAESIRPYVTTEALAPLDVKMEIGGFLLTARIDRIHEAGLVYFRYARLKGSDFLSSWLRQIVLNIAGRAGYPEKGFVFGSDGSFEYGRVDAAREVMEGLLNAYRAGLTKPLKFFPESSWAYAQAIHLKGKSKEEGLEEARRVWERNDFSGRPGEGDEPYLNLCFRNGDALDAEFAETAENIFKPLLSYRHDIGA